MNTLKFTLENTLANTESTPPLKPPYHPQGGLSAALILVGGAAPPTPPPFLGFANTLACLCAWHWEGQCFDVTRARRTDILGSLARCMIRVTRRRVTAAAFCEMVCAYLLQGQTRDMSKQVLPLTCTANLSSKHTSPPEKVGPVPKMSFTETPNEKTEEGPCVDSLLFRTGSFPAPFNVPGWAAGWTLRPLIFCSEMEMSWKSL